MPYLLSKESFLKIGEFIYRKSGIYLQEQKHYDKLNKYIDFRVSELGINNFKEYFFKLRFEDECGKEFQKLINEVTENETYFFREKEQFEVLVNIILPELHKVLPASKTIRILSSPCSSGEEPYSMLLHILEEESVLEQRNIEIVGIDIDSSIIEEAKKVNFTQKSVHAIPKEILEKWFKKKNLGFEPVDDLCKNVDFQVVSKRG